MISDRNRLHGRFSLPDGPDLVDDLLPVRTKPEMIGIGPFIPIRTQFSRLQDWFLQLALVLISILRLMLPTANIPSTTALGTIDPNGSEMGLWQEQMW